MSASLLCVCVFVYVYLCTCVHLYVCVCGAAIYMCKYICTYVCIYVYTYVSVCVYVCAITCSISLNSYHTTLAHPQPSHVRAVHSDIPDDLSPETYHEIQVLYLCANASESVEAFLVWFAWGLPEIRLDCTYICRLSHSLHACQH